MKDKVLKMSAEKYYKLNDENYNILSMNRGLQKTIEELDNQCKSYQILVKQLKEKVNNYEKPVIERKLSFNSNISNESSNKKRRKGVDYTGKGINLDELLINASDLSEGSDEVVEHKTTIKLKSTKKSLKEKTKSKSTNNKVDNSDAIKNKYKSAFFYELLFRLIDL